MSGHVSSGERAWGTVSRWGRLKKQQKKAYRRLGKKKLKTVDGGGKEKKAGRRGGVASGGCHTRKGPGEKKTGPYRIMDRGVLNEKGSALKLSRKLGGLPRETLGRRKKMFQVKAVEKPSARVKSNTGGGKNRGPDR